MIYESKELTYKGKVVFHKMSTPHPKRQLKPFYSNEACFMFVNEGNFSVRTSSEFINFESGKGLLTKCINFFIEATEQQRTDNDKLELIGVYLFPSIIEELLQIDLSVSKHTVPFAAKEIQVNKLLDVFKESINVLLDNPELADEITVSTKLKEFILLISKTQEGIAQLDFLSAMFKTHATEFAATINNNLYSNLSVSEFAQLCGMSVSSFKRKFAETFKESPGKYIEKKKLQKALNLLTSSTLRVSDIAYDCGYETISTFNRSFKAHFGKSPSDYRLG